MAGGPSHLETFDYKPKLAEMHGQPMPESFTKGQPIAQLQGQKLNCFAPAARVQQVTASRARRSARSSRTSATIADDICIIRSMQTEAINHDPAHTFMNTGTTISGRPAWARGLTTAWAARATDLPGFVVLTSTGPVRPGRSRSPRGSGTAASCPAGSRASSSARKGDPVLYVGNPQGVDARAAARRRRRRAAAQPHRRTASVDDPEIATRIAQYEMAFRMQTSVPELMDFRDEPQQRARPVRHARAPTARSRPTACWPAGWPSAACASSSSTTATGTTTAAIKEPHRGHRRRGRPGAAALITDLKQRGMLDDTLVIWGGEFGRTPMAQGDGRDHHIKGFSMWLAGGGIKGGITYGATDELGYNAVENVVHVHDLHATILHLLGIDHKRLTYRFQGRDFRLTDVAGQRGASRSWRDPRSDYGCPAWKPPPETERGASTPFHLIHSMRVISIE